MIRDLDASKGSTKVNGQAVSEKGTVLRPGDVLAIGKTKIVVCNDRYVCYRPPHSSIPYMPRIPNRPRALTFLRAHVQCGQAQQVPARGPLGDRVAAGLVLQRHALHGLHQ